MGQVSLISFIKKPALTIIELAVKSSNYVQELAKQFGENEGEPQLDLPSFKGVFTNSANETRIMVKEITDSAIELLQNASECSIKMAAEAAEKILEAANESIDAATAIVNDITAGLKKSADAADKLYNESIGSPLALAKTASANTAKAVLDIRDKTIAVAKEGAEEILKIAKDAADASIKNAIDSCKEGITAFNNVESQITKETNTFGTTIAKHANEASDSIKKAVQEEDKITGKYAGEAYKQSFEETKAVAKTTDSLVIEATNDEVTAAKDFRTLMLKVVQTAADDDVKLAIEACEKAVAAAEEFGNKNIFAAEETANKNFEIARRTAEINLESVINAYDSQKHVIKDIANRAVKLTIQNSDKVYNVADTLGDSMYGVAEVVGEKVIDEARERVKEMT